MFENIEIETPNSQRTFSFLAPHYKDFNNDVTFGEGDSYFGSATSSATGQPLFTPSKNVPFTPVLNGVNGVLYQLNLANSKKVEKLTTKSPLKEPNKIKFLDYNLDVKAVANKENGPPVVKIVKKAVNKANIIPTNTAKQVKNYLGRKSQGIRKRQPIKKPGTVLTIPKPFRFHTRKRPNVINKYSPKSPFISLAERIQQYLEKTPDRFKSKLRSASNYVNLPTKAKSPFLRTKLRAERIKMTNKENEINNDKVQSKPVDSSDVKSGRVKKTKPKITIPVLLTVLPLPTTTTTKPFKLRTDIRGEKYQQSFRKKINGLNKREKDDLSFRAKPTPNLLPYRPRKSAKPITEVVGFKLHTDARLEKRKTYDEQRNLRDQEEKILKERKQIEEERNKQQIRQLRTELIHHAQPAK
ncbi:460_t:CDS:2, partial [Rhizophagus irregularis]